MRLGKTTCGKTIYLPHMKKTITLNPFISDGGVQFIPVYLDCLAGVAKRTRKNRSWKL